MSRDDRLVVVRLRQLERLIDEQVTAALQKVLSQQADKVERISEKLTLQKEVLTHREVAADYLNGEVTPETVIRYVKEEGLPATKKGRAWYVKKDDLEAWLTERS